ncbi:hypothetical protein O181_060166 [Austropuccinia psidii MF-1]|uniref:Retrotransposon gag domain-containing protein n=1 Tax=Austropuccinia psidii MF-1 TaxID=1389203 RepID=A0A9Q3HWC6_9BASI|nr:hypothetical protein [Austropuccinia psidii MF-1]
MPVQHSPPAKNTRSQRIPAVLTPTARAPLEHTPSVQQLSANLDRGPPMVGGAPSGRGAREILGEVEEEEGEESVEEEDSGETEVADALANSPEIMEQMTQFMGQLTQAVTPRDNSTAPALKTPSMKAPDSFDGTQAHKLTVFTQACQLIFHNNPENFFSEMKKVLYSTSFLTSRAGKWIEPYLSNISNEDPSYCLNNWPLFDSQLFTLFGDPNEVRKAEEELDNLRLNESVDLPSFPSFEWDFFIIDSLKGEGLILGYDFLYHFNPLIDSENGLITYYSSHKDSGGIIPSTCNDFASAVNSVALTLLAVIDEVLKEIKDVGEVVAIYSLHLFQADMDLPPSSFHASLEEQWDEEEEPEEIETVLKVGPPSNHQYLDGLSKMKGKKLPPHRACYHHIELEGLLPPRGVIN